ncbi:MAG TPA: Fe-S-cluster-containing hydrogenase [Anaeromyxobacteraceae bacterium]|nr:Fe-S-cluster-containing hydrogenase [Anaeromyxobacteraceae bacterium]
MPSLGHGSRLPIYGQPDLPGAVGADGRHPYRSLEERSSRALPSPEFPPGAAEAPEGLSRRNFIQLMGASAALASLAACRPPRHKILPYVRPPEKALLPGAPAHYATSVSRGGYAIGLLVTSYDGRPTKVEGNPDHPASLGAAGSLEQALLLDLYDPRRARGFRREKTPLAYRSLLRELALLAASHEKDEGTRLRFLTSATSSPVLLDMRRQIATRFPKARFFAYESLSEDEVLDGARRAFGRALAARHHLGGARIILALEADFLGSGPEALRLAREFAQGREPGPHMNRLYAAEAQLSVTGGSADHRLRMKPSEVVHFARGLADVLAKGHGLAALAPLGAPLADERLARAAKVVAADLAGARGASLVLAGPGQPAAVHALAHALNAALGNAGQTVDYGAPAFDEPTGPTTLAELAGELNAGAVDTVVVTAENPVYGAPADLELTAALGRAKNTLYLAYREDETAAGASWLIAKSHPFESWGDARAHDGTVSLVQPLIEPLFESTSELELLAGFVDRADLGSYRLLTDSWRRARAGEFDAAFEGWLARGIVAGTAAAAEKAEPDLAAVAAALQEVKPPVEGLEASFVPDYKTLDGRFAENAWMQELAHPVSKITWDNAAYLSPATAKKLGLEDGARVALRLGERSVEAPVLVMPGHADETVTLPLGYGRWRAGPVGTNVGFDAGRLRTSKALSFAGGVKIERTSGHTQFALTQEHFSMEGRELSLSFNARDFKPEKLEHLRGLNPTLQAPVSYQDQQYKWGMAIDLGKCIGCAACEIACQAENNIAVVGREQVTRSREMHWIRIDRYYSGPPEDPEIVAQPVMCQQCEAAPCEYVCPVNATVHSDEGLNEMVYNRCVGTRYCSNNCPYKVRRFNYLDFRGQLAPTEKMLMNPEVTVRTRGVMEKCTYCVQRIERARIATREEGRAIREGEFTTACAQACPAQAIVFGNLNDPGSAVTKWHKDERRYDLLHELGTRPRTAYLARIRNPNPDLT